MKRQNSRLARFAAPAAFLAAATVAIMIVRSGLENGETTNPPATTAVTTTTPGTTAPPPSPGAAGEFYAVQAGDTLAVIADEHGTTVEQLLILNPEVDPVALSVGQRIRVK
ncbi:MAG: LysM domain-containing protein [Gaiellaceae bacterium]